MNKGMRVQEQRDEGDAATKPRCVTKHKSSIWTPMRSPATMAVCMHCTLEIALSERLSCSLPVCSSYAFSSSPVLYLDSFSTRSLRSLIALSHCFLSARSYASFDLSRSFSILSICRFVSIPLNSSQFHSTFSSTFSLLLIVDSLSSNKI